METKNQTSVILNRIYNGEKVARFLAWRPEEKDHCIVEKQYDDNLEEIDSSIIRLLTELEAEELGVLNV